MTKKEAYQTGYDTGYEIAKAQAPELVLELGGFPQRPSLATMQELAREIASFASQHESEIYRQYSPFEFFAQEINDSRDPDMLWEAYDDGVHKGALAAAKAYLKGRR
jgi:hypothetical protein